MYVQSGIINDEEQYQLKSKSLRCGCCCARALLRSIPDVGILPLDTLFLGSIIRRWCCLRSFMCKFRTDCMDPDNSSRLFLLSAFAT